MPSHRRAYATQIRFFDDPYGSNIAKGCGLRRSFGLEPLMIGYYAFLPPRLVGNGRFGLYATMAFLPPKLVGKGRFGLYAFLPPRLVGNGRFGLLLLDTVALAKLGTTRTAEKAATSSSFMVRASQGSLVLVAYRLRNTNLSRALGWLLQLWWNLTLRRLVILPRYFIL
jgi:hypothetical protein